MKKQQNSSLSPHHKPQFPAEEAQKSLTEFDMQSHHKHVWQSWVKSSINSICGNGLMLATEKVPSIKLWSIHRVAINQVQQYTRENYLQICRQGNGSHRGDGSENQRILCVTTASESSHCELRKDGAQESLKLRHRHRLILMSLTKQSQKITKRINGIAFNMPW